MHVGFGLYTSDTSEDACTALAVADQNVLIYVFTGKYCSEVFYFLK